MRIVTPEEMQALEARFMAETGVSSATLMGRAAEGLLKAAVELTGRSGPVPQETHRLAGLRAAAFCGPGANGGDGWALAWRLCDMGCEVTAITVGMPRPGTAAHENYCECTNGRRAIRVIDLAGAGQDLCGRLICHDIGIPEDRAPRSAPVYMSPGDVHIPRRRHDTHKGTYGHLMLIAGSDDYAGAALLSTRAALRSGAGLVTAACVAGLRPLLQLSAPAAMALEAAAGPVFDEESAERIAGALTGKSALAVGPGLTRRAAPDVVACALKSGLPAVLDADALNLIAATPALRALVGPRHVLTPHPGEMARLLGRPCGDPAQDARALARELGCVVLLKGCATCVSDGLHVFMMTPGVPGMACGGSGDVLTGVIGALLAQGMSPVRSAVYGAMLHGRAGTLAQQRLGEVSMNAADIIDELPQAFMEATGER